MGSILLDFNILAWPQKASSRAIQAIFNNNLNNLNNLFL